MAQKFTVPITVKQLTSAGSDAITIYVDADTYARLKVEAGGRLVWGPGNGVGDVNLYRDGADVLKTDDTFKTPTLFVDNIEIDPSGASVGDALTFDGTKFSSASVSATVVANFDDLADVTLTSPEKYQTVVYDGTEWINEFPTTVSLAYNAEATTLQVGEAVYLFGGTGNHASVKRADNDSDATSAKTMGLVAEAIPAGQSGPVVTRGYVTGMDLSVGYTAGQTLYLGEDGGYTTTKPHAPEHLVYLGVVVRATNNGIIYVAAQNGYELDEIHDVDLITNPPTNGDVLTYNGSMWVSASVSGGGSASLTVSATAPSSPSEGDMWFESDTGRTYVYYDSYWVEVGAVSAGSRIAVGSNPPSNPTAGDTWFDSDTAQTFIYYDSQWIEIGASAMAATIAGTAPSNAIAGQIWFDSNTGGTYVYFNSTWVEVGASALDTLLNTIEAKGDILVGTADNAVDNLTVGSNGQILVADSAEATGLKWETPNYASTGKAIAMAIVFGG